MPPRGIRMSLTSGFGQFGNRLEPYLFLPSLAQQSQALTLGLVSLDPGFVKHSGLSM